jgi:hypothetical protein
MATTPVDGERKAIDARADDPKSRAWVQANRPAVERFIKASALADGMASWASDDPRRGYPVEGENAAILMELPLVTGGMRQEEGDLSGAWECYRAVLRMMFHLRRGERLKDHVRDHSQFGLLRERLAGWAADPRTTIPQVRRALDELVEYRTAPESDARALKREYLDLMQFLHGPVWPSVRRMQKSAHRELIVLLASELYRRDRGTAPPSEQALVGTFLQSLPDDGSDELADENTPTISDLDDSTRTASK